MSREQDILKDCVSRKECIFLKEYYFLFVNILHLHYKGIKGEDDNFFHHMYCDDISH